VKIARALRCATLASALLFASADAHAYRPFDGTDAEVAELHEFELELMPVGYLAQRDNQALLIPQFVLNYGFADDNELVIDGRGFWGLNDSQRFFQHGRYDDSDVLIKHVFRRGILQGETGPSVAVEAGPLLPSIGVPEGWGAIANTIVSFRNEWGTLHLNGALMLTRETHDRELFTSAIIEGPFTWKVRPVAELYYDRDFGGATRYSALGGAIWRFSDDLDFDIALRGALVDKDAEGEIRGGLTWTIPVF
jgi:hypothetical protein